MYSILPALVSSLFLGYGIYVVGTQGFTRTTTSFFAVCITSFFWQGTWAVLFQVKDPHLAIFLIKFGYLLILFLPTSIYHFLIEISERAGERRYVYLSYGTAFVLAVFLFDTDLFISGYYEFFWGYYPKAGPLHPLHVLQTMIVVSRGIYVTYRQQQAAAQNRRIKLQLCIGGLLVYFFAAIDYLCNYGIEFYPPGVLFIAISLGIITIAIVRYGLFNPMAAAASMAHEMRTPLLTIRMQAGAIARFWPAIYEGYQLAVQHGLCKPAVRPQTLERLSNIADAITHEVDRSNTVINMMLASATMEHIDSSTFTHHSIKSCVSEALGRYPFGQREREQVVSDAVNDFQFYGSDTLLVYVLFNLLKNALYALKAASKGNITISTARYSSYNALSFTDTGIGVARHVLPHIFDAFFTTKGGSGAGIGLAFCHRVMTSFGGGIRCDSVVGEYTTFILEFPVCEPEGRVKKSALSRTTEHA